MKRLIKYILHPEHLIIAVLAVLILGVGCLIIVNISFLNPISEAIDDFSMTDMFYEIDHSTTIEEESNLISIVDLTNVYDRAEIGEILTILSCANPKLLVLILYLKVKKMIQ